MKRYVLLLATLATTAGCKKEQPPAAPATPPPAPTAPAPVREDPLTAVPRTDATLSFLEPREGKCQWMRADPVAQKRATVAALEGDCKGARLFWSPDLGKVLVWFDPERVGSGGYISSTSSPRGFPEEQPTPGAASRLYEVTVATGKVRPVAVPTVDGTIRTFGYKGTALLALSQRSLTDEQRDADSITVDGQVVPFDKELEGIPALAFAYQFGEDGQWKRVEVKATAEGADYSPGVQVLEATRDMGPTSDTLLNTSLSDEGAEPTPEQAAQLLPLRPAPLLKQKEAVEGDGTWSRVTTPGGSFYVWQVSGEFVHSTGHLVLEVGGQPQPVKDLGFTDGDFVAVRTQGPFVLVSADEVGTHPRLYDLRSGKRVFHSDAARVATFWPAPPTP